MKGLYNLMLCVCECAMHRAKKQCYSFATLFLMASSGKWCRFFPVLLPFFWLQPFIQNIFPSFCCQSTSFSLAFSSICHLISFYVLHFLYFQLNCDEQWHFCSCTGNNENKLFVIVFEKANYCSCFFFSNTTQLLSIFFLFQFWSPLECIQFKIKLLCDNEI